jgi:hypothetical protein
MAALGPAMAAAGIPPDRADFERPCNDANCMTPQCRFKKASHMATHYPNGPGGDAWVNFAWLNWPATPSSGPALCAVAQRHVLGCRQGM